MNRRHARRLATIRLAAAARALSAEVDDAEEFSPADRLRIRREFEAIAHELDARAGLVPRGSRPTPVDPDQATLFELDKDHGEVRDQAGVG